jgi:hypothetical protein
MRHIVIFGLPVSTKRSAYRKKKKKSTENKMRVLIFSTTFVWNISHSKKNSAWYSINVRTTSCKVATRYSCQILMELEFSQHIFVKSLNIKFHKNPSSGSGRAVMTKLIVAFLNFANAHKYLCSAVCLPFCVDLRTNSDYLSIQH